MNFREAKGKVVEWVDTSIPKFSNFLYVDNNYHSLPVLRRILSLARKLNYKSLLVEEISSDECDLLRQENDALQKVRQTYVSSTVRRLSFWSCPPQDKNAAKHFLGYAVVKQDFYSDLKISEQHVYESVISQSRGKEQNNFIHCERKYDVNTAAGKVTVKGALYAQQNGYTFACAHVALRSVLASLLPDGDITYANINALAGIDTSVVVSHMTPPQIESVLTKLNIPFHKIVHEPNQKVELAGDFQRDIYGFIESGSPALMGFELEAKPPDPPARHMISVLGHTFNEDGWVADAQRNYFGQAGAAYISSESWLSAYVVHDDNFGPHFCLPRHYLQKKHFRLIYGFYRWPTKIAGLEIETIAFEYARALAGANFVTGNAWHTRFRVFAASNLVLRALLVHRDEYVTHLGNLDSSDGMVLEKEHLDILKNHLPEHFWMVEVSAQELFTATRRKFGEVLLSATHDIPKPLDLSLLIAARLPGVVVVSSGGKPKDMPTRVESHTTLFSYG